MVEEDAKKSETIIFNDTLTSNDGLKQQKPTKLKKYQKNYKPSAKTLKKFRFCPILTLVLLVVTAIGLIAAAGVMLARFNCEKVTLSPFCEHGTCLNADQLVDSILVNSQIDLSRVMHSWKEYGIETVIFSKTVLEKAGISNVTSRLEELISIGEGMHIAVSIIVDDAFAVDNDHPWAVDPLNLCLVSGSPTQYEGKVVLATFDDPIRERIIDSLVTLTRLGVLGFIFDKIPPKLNSNTCEVIRETDSEFFESLIEQIRLCERCRTTIGGVLYKDVSTVEQLSHERTPFTMQFGLSNDAVANPPLNPDKILSDLTESSVSYLYSGITTIWRTSMNGLSGLYTDPNSHSMAVALLVFLPGSLMLDVGDEVRVRVSEKQQYFSSLLDNPTEEGLLLFQNILRSYYSYRKNFAQMNEYTQFASQRNVNKIIILTRSKDDNVGFLLVGNFNDSFREIDVHMSVGGRKTGKVVLSTTEHNKIDKHVDLNKVTLSAHEIKIISLL